MNVSTTITRRFITRIDARKGECAGEGGQGREKSRAMIEAVAADAAPALSIHYPT
jgi:hypothetical protein